MVRVNIHTAAPRRCHACFFSDFIDIRPRVSMYILHWDYLSPIYSNNAAEKISLIYFDCVVCKLNAIQREKERQKKRIRNKRTGRLILQFHAKCVRTFLEYPFITTAVKYHNKSYYFLEAVGRANRAPNITSPVYLCCFLTFNLYFHTRKILVTHAFYFR